VLHEDLWEANRDLARACLAHPFVQGLAAGTLDRKRFAGYIAQDAYFLRVFVQAYALIVARRPEVDDFLELLNGAANEIGLHRLYSLEYGIRLQEVSPNPACLAYTDFLLHTAWHAELGEILAGMTPCMRLYAWLGGNLAPGSGGPYQKWIDTYSSPDFHALAARIEILLDRNASDTPTVRDHYRYAMQCELDFFQACS
jgi:thiaminase/transcriptional activator TenA